MSRLSFNRYGLHLTGPSIVSIVERPAEEAPRFKRYSVVLESADFVFLQEALDRLLKYPGLTVDPNYTQEFRQ